jgi:hypothetical protein
LEHEVKTAEDLNAQLQQQTDEKLGSLENIIETLLELIAGAGSTIPRSLQKRIQKECPKVFTEVVLSSCSSLHPGRGATQGPHIPGSPGPINPPTTMGFGTMTQFNGAVLSGGTDMSQVQDGFEFVNI